MGGIHEITDGISVETRRLSFALVVVGAVVDQGANYGRIEIEYADIPDLRKALDLAEKERGQ